MSRNRMPAAVLEDLDDALPIKYTPVDEILLTTRIRILRTMRHFDCCTSWEIADLMEVAGVDDGTTERNNFNAAWSRLFRQGHIQIAYETKASHSKYKSGSRVYKISPSGRELLNRELAKAVPA